MTSEDWDMLPDVVVDTTKAKVRNGSTYNVEITTHYFQTLKQVKGKIK